MFKSLGSGANALSLLSPCPSSQTLFRERGYSNWVVNLVPSAQHSGAVPKGFRVCWYQGHGNGIVFIREQAATPWTELTIFY